MSGLNNRGVVAYAWRLDLTVRGWWCWIQHGIVDTYFWSENAEQLWYHVTMRILEMGFGQMTKNSELMMRKAVSENLLAFLPRTAIVSHCAQVILHSIILVSALTRNIWITSQETWAREQGFAGILYLPLIWWEQPFHQNWSYHWVKSQAMGQIHLI